MDIQSLEASVSLIVTLLPIVLAVAGTAFGVRLRRRAASAKEATVTIIQFAQEPETLAAQKQRRQIQFFDIGLWLVLFAIFALLAVLRTSEFVLLPPPQWRPFRALVIALDIVVVIIYLLIFWMYARALVALWRNKLGARTHAFCERPVVLSGTVRRLARKSHNALRRLGADVIEIDSEHGLLCARRHFFFNLYKVYFDEITVQIKQTTERHCEVLIQSDGIMPSLVRNRTRNMQNILALVGLITE